MIEIFTSKTCAPCMALKFKLEEDWGLDKLTDVITFKDIGVFEHRDNAVKRGVRAVPAIFIDGNQVNKEKLFEHLDAVKH